MISHFWIFESLGLVQVSENIIEFIRKPMQNWNVYLTLCGEYLVNVDIRRGRFQGDSLIPLLFGICMIPLTQVIRKVQSGYALKNGEKLNHLLVIDEIKIFPQYKY